MSKIVHFVSRYPLSILCVVLIWILSLMPFFPETPFDQVEFIDKWTHLVMYGGTCSVIWWEYLRNHQILDGEKLFFYAWLCPALMSGLLELLQEYYLDGEPAAAVAGKLDMSESTFWRKRKRSVNTILRFCERHSPTQHCG